MRAEVDESRPPRQATRTGRALGWTAGSVVAVAVLGLLVVAAATIWYFGVSAPNRQWAIAQAEQDMAREAAAEAQTALARAAADGRLTDDEISTAVGGPAWDIRRAEAGWALRANFQGSDPLCFSFEITMPLGPDTRVTGAELPACPEITPAG